MSLTRPATIVDKGRIWRAGAVAVLASVVANVIVFLIITLVLDLPDPSAFPYLNAGRIAMLTILFTTLGVVVYWLLAGRSNRPVRAFRVVATITLLLSAVPNLLLWLNPESAQLPDPEARWGFLVLLIFHVIAYLVATSILIAQTTD